jgi:hypothetical protein
MTGDYLQRAMDRPVQEIRLSLMPTACDAAKLLGNHRNANDFAGFDPCSDYVVVVHAPAL